MTTPKPYVSRGALAEKSRRRVRPIGVNRIGKRTTVPRQKRPPAKRPRYQTAVGMLGSFSAMCTALFAATGSIFAVAGAVTTAAGGVAVAHLEYRRHLAEVKRTGKPIGTVGAKTVGTGDLEDVPEPTPVDLDPQPVRVHHRAGCPICARTDEHTHTQDEWQAITGTWEYDNPRPAQRVTQPSKPAARKPAASQPAHPGCQASAPRYCRCPGGPNRRGAKTGTRKTTPRKRTK